MIGQSLSREVGKPSEGGILVVDDDPAGLQLIVDLMGKQGYHVRPANSGELALRSAASRLPELILLDIQMPGMDGYEVCRRLKSDPKTRDVPVLFISALHDTESKVLGLRAGAVDFVTKPYQAEEVLARVHTHLLLARTRNALDAMCLQLTERIVERNNNLEAMSDALEAKVAEHQATAEKLRLASKAIESSGDAIVITDERGGMLSVNPAFSAITGYEPGEILGQSPKVLLSYRSPQDFPVMLSNSLYATGAWSGEVWIQPKSGKVLPVWLNISAVQNEQLVKTHYVGIFFDISSIKKAQARIDYLAHHDVLTGLPNRVLLRDRFEMAAAMADRLVQPIGVFFIDLDHFKSINDALGHPTGDKYLQNIAKRIKHSIRNSDSLCRLGGDEFIALICQIKPKTDLKGIAEKIIAGISAPIEIDGHELQRSASIGIARYPDDGLDIDTLIRKADTAMYRAKDQGRNSCATFCGHMDEEVEHKLNLECALGQALERNQLFLRYQPQVDLQTGKIVGMEALVRWQRPGIGEVSPDAFIRLAEESGLIVRLGKWVIEETCRQARFWVGQNLCVPISVNISATELRRGHVAMIVDDALRCNGLSSVWLVVEITESGLIDDTTQTRAMLEHLGKLGVHLAIDDFGTGYSSFAYLRRFAVSQLKIDQSFVARMKQDSEDHAIVNAIIQLANILRIPTVAEGVETQTQRQLLIAGGCQIGQGYLFSRPLLPDEASEALRRGYCG